MLDQEEVQKAIDKFRSTVIKEARKNLTNGRKNSSKKLHKSIKGVSKTHKNSISLYFSMEDYGDFQDKGVSGLKVKHNTKYSFKKGVPSRQMLKNLDKWIIRKGIAPRGKGGTFAKRNSLKFAIAKSIFNKGIKPTLFFTKPFEKHFNKLPDEIIKKYDLKIDNIKTI